jgi:hypothetical protein
MNVKRSIMSLLLVVRARKADLDKDGGVYAMSDQAMVDQVVSDLAKKPLMTAAVFPALSKLAGRMARRILTERHVTSV